VPPPSREAHTLSIAEIWRKEKRKGGRETLRCSTLDFPFRLIGAPQLVRPVTGRSFPDKQGRHGSITHSYNLSLPPSLSPSLPPSLLPMMKR